MFGREITIQALGKQWKFGRLDKNTLDAFGAWVKEQVGDPFELADKLLARAEAIPPGALQDAVIVEWKDATREAKAISEQLRGFSLESALGQRYIKSIEGMGFMALCMLRGNHPDIEPDVAFSVFQEVGPDKLAEIMDQASGADKLPKSPKNSSGPAVRTPLGRDPLDKSALSIGSPSNGG